MKADKRRWMVGIAALAVAALGFGYQADKPAPYQSAAEAAAKSAGCITCHKTTDSATMHLSGAVTLGCTDCHGGNAAATTKAEGHPKPKLPWLFKTSANPVRANADWLKESAEYVKFVNPGDLRVAHETCGQQACHPAEVRNVRTSMMTHSGMLWGAAAYANGSFPYKNPFFGESYARDGTPQIIKTIPAPTPELTATKGVLPMLVPLIRWETSQPGNLLRVFERGGGPRAEIGNPDRDSEPGNPDEKLSDRGLGTGLRIDPVIIGAQKTRLLDPILSMPGTNDHPGDYRQSGCTACHVIYANDRWVSHSGPYASAGNMGMSQSNDPTIPKNESGHPIKHEFTRSIPTSTCIVCHIHPGTNMEMTYLGMTWWDNETDGKFMYPEKQKDLTDEERFKAWMANPETAAGHGKWSDPQFLAKTGTPEFNAQLQNTQFGDFHGHGWIFREVFKRDRKGNMLDAEDKVVAPDDKDKFKKGVHLEDIHLEKGMHCSDCHFGQDNHGNGQIYGEPRNAVEIDCIDCHGTIGARSNLRTSAAAAPKGGTNMELMRTPWGLRRFYYEGGKLYQRSMIDKDRAPWEVVQVVDSITKGNPHYNEASALAKTMQKDGKTWGSALVSDASLAHANSSMTCYACHTSWTTSCFGCHLAQMADQKTKMLHNEGTTTRNWTSYNFEVLRDDIYMLGIDGTVTGHRIAPTRSTCAVVVSSQNANRDWTYYQQQTISSPGYSGFAFSTYYPHTARAKETKVCTDCHISRDNNNNAWMAQLLMQGTNLVNFMGRYIFVADGDKGLDAIATAEHDDPPAVFGSDLQKLVFPSNYEKLQKRGFQLNESIHHEGEVLDLQSRGEYLYTAMGKDGFRIFDTANIDNKSISEKITTAPVSPLGQRFYIKTKYATAVATPATTALDPLRHVPEVNEEKPIALMYGFLYVTDKYEGLVVVGNPDLKAKAPGVLTLLDGDPSNNFLVKGLAFNPGGALNGARRITIAGTYAYILCDKGLVVVDIANPAAPKITGGVDAPDLVEPQGIAVQFRYAFVVDKQGLKVLDTTDLAKPRLVKGALAPLADARNVYVARTYAYVAGGKQGLVMVDVERPDHPVVAQVFNAGGAINDLRDVKLGMVAASAFAYLADGVNGMRIVQLFAPTDNPNYLGFSPVPTPKLIATYKTKGPALAVSKGIDRDRAVDESGNQLSVFNRRGSRPFNAEEMKRLYVHPRTGEFYSVTNTAP